MLLTMATSSETVPDPGTGVERSEKGPVDGQSLRMSSLLCRPHLPDGQEKEKVAKCRRTNSCTAMRFIRRCSACVHIASTSVPLSELCPDCAHGFCKGKGSGKCCRNYKAFKSEARERKRYPFPSCMTARERREAYSTFVLAATGDGTPTSEKPGIGRRPGELHALSQRSAPPGPGSCSSAYDWFFSDLFVDVAEVVAAPESGDKK